MAADAVLSYCQSRQMDAQGRILADDYTAYTSSISKEKWQSAYVEEGLEEIRTALAVKNTIPNVSAVLFRRQPLIDSLRTLAATLSNFRVAGDWRLYVELLARGRIAFTPSVLNRHRRHATSVTSTLSSIRHLQEILEMQTLVRARFGVTAEVCAQARAYAQDVYCHFGLNAGEHASVGEHPDFQRFFARPAPVKRSAADAAVRAD
jgi:hypothetical protein